MRVIIADQAGVCFGVKRALDLVNAEAEKGEPLATLGPLIHNPQVVRKLEEKGVRVVMSVEDAGEGAIVMPSHGVPREVQRGAEEAGIRVVDATCPFVANVHQRVEALAKEGYVVVVVGDAGHSEVKAIKSAAGDDDIALALVELQDLETELPADELVEIPGQTHINLGRRQEGLHADIDAQSTLDLVKDGPLDGAVGIDHCLETVPDL